MSAACSLCGCAVAITVLGTAGSNDHRLQTALHAQASQSGARSIVVISDLHMGIGRDASGEWNPTEDFRWAAEFAQFLEADRSKRAEPS